MIKKIAISFLFLFLALPALATDSYTEELYELYCQSCHGIKGSGAPLAFNPKSWRPFLKRGMDRAVNNAIVGTGNMPPMGTCTECGPEELQDLIEYMSNKRK